VCVCVCKEEPCSILFRNVSSVSPADKAMPDSVLILHTVTFDLPITAMAHSVLLRIQTEISSFHLISLE